jgi:hypothetical protein
MEWLIGVPVVALLLLCPLMMVGMIVGGWVFGRRAMGHGGHSGHGMMMCHPMGHGPDESAAPTVADLKAERERLDEIIARAERDGVAR